MSSAENFGRDRAAAFDALLAQMEEHLRPAAFDDVAALAERECWALLAQGFHHLKDGAPDGQPGTMAEALSRASLRAGALAAALGVKPPQFEPVYFSVDYATGREAGLFLCGKLVTGAEEDFPKSRQVIQQKIVAEKPGDMMKEQMARTFDALATAYPRACAAARALIDSLQET